MYPKYQTLSLILHSYNIKEADKAFVLFTKHFGIIHARAAGLRKETSKLRYVLSARPFCEIVVLRGKAGWRITEVKEFAQNTEFSYDKLSKIGKVFKLLVRIMPKEEANADLFDDVLCLVMQNHVTDADIIKISAQIMRHAGYMPHLRDKNPAQENMELLKKELNEALVASQLFPKIRF